MFKENYIITGKIVSETGLHIGGANESIEIGGVDNIVIRDSVSDLPFIPGSSLKGKMRSLMELNDSQSSANIIRSKGDPCKCGECLPCLIFGTSADESSEQKQKGPTRIIVRDSYPTPDTIGKWEENEEVVRGAEVKYENSINRINSSANPRPSERVPKDSMFDFEIIFSVYEDDDPSNLNGVFESMLLVEDNYLGGSGTRGYGKIRFEDITITKKTKDFYKKAAEADILIEGVNVKEALAKLSE